MKYDYDCYSKLAETNTRMLYARDKLTWKQFGKEIRIFNLYEYVSGIAMKYINQLSQIQKTKSKRIFLVYFFLGLFDFVQRFGLIAYIVWLCLKGVVSIGEFTSFMVAMITCFSCVNDNAKILVQVAESMKYIKSYFDVLDAVEEKEQEQKKKEISKDFGKLKTLQVTDLRFQYPNTDREILKGVSVSFEAGKKYGIVGRNGSGKTTFLKVLLGLYQVPDGTIQFNGCEKNYFSLKKWYSLFSVVLQDFNLYAYTLRDNIEMFQENKVTALKESDKIAGLNLEDYLSREYEAGHTVSGGEAQKIAFSRAVHKKAEIVVLDEPTSALSPDSEIAFYEEMKHRLSDKTLILVSHRLASCKLCDEILVFDAGQIVERGTHEQLMQDKGIYYEMYTLQKNLYANEMQEKQSIALQ